MCVLVPYQILSNPFPFTPDLRGFGDRQDIFERVSSVELAFLNALTNGLHPVISLVFDQTASHLKFGRHVSGLETT